jgi:4-diphosphocytidyl-2-C-methyl-D-erythritol kinase
MIVFPNVKINLGLYITEKRPDGFHNLSSLFYPVQWTDALEAITTDNQELNFTSSGNPIPGDVSKNLVVKAYHLLSADFQLPGMRVHLHKNLPMGAGLGGGSSDGAFMLQLINAKAELGLSNTQLQSYAAQLGSDCPFFILNRPCLVSGRGEIIEPIDFSLAGHYIVILMPPLTVGTAEAYSWIKPAQPTDALRDILSSPISEWKNRLRNDFEEPVSLRHPLIRELKELLYAEGAVYASMSGSGAALFGIFPTQPDLKSFSNYTHFCTRLN